MTEKGKLETAEVRIRTAYSKFGLALGIFALLATIAGVVIMLRTEKTEVAAQVLSCGELTKYSPIAELKGHFTYAGEDVAHLWKLTVKLINSGDKTIVGEGNQKNIIGEGINFVFPDDTRILNIEEEANTFQSTVVQPKPNHVQIRFSQWRSGEYSVASFYVASDEPLDADPFPSIRTRDIIDGDVVIQDFTEKRPREPMFVIDRLPRAISMPGKVIGGIVAGLLGLLAIILIAMGISGWKPALGLEKWKKRYLSSFSDYLDQLEPAFSERDKRMFKKKPYTLPEPFWPNFEGEKITKAPTLDSRGDCIGFIIVSVFILFGSISLILVIIPA